MFACSHVLVDNVWFCRSITGPRAQSKGDKQRSMIWHFHPSIKTGNCHVQLYNGYRRYMRKVWVESQHSSQTNTINIPRAHPGTKVQTADEVVWKPQNMLQSIHQPITSSPRCSSRIYISPWLWKKQPFQEYYIKYEHGYSSVSAFLFIRFYVSAGGLKWYTAHRTSSTTTSLCFRTKNSWTSQTSHRVLHLLGSFINVAYRHG